MNYYRGVPFIFIYTVKIYLNIILFHINEIIK